MAKRRTVNEKLLDEVTHRSVNLMRFSEKVRGEVVAYLDSMKGQLIKDLSETDPELAMTASRRRRAEALLAQANETIDSTYGNISEHMVTALSKTAMNEGAWAGKVLQVALPLELATTALGEETLRALADRATVLGIPLGEWWTKQSERQQTLFATAIRDGILKGETTDELVARVRAPESEGGVGLKTQRRNAETLVRSSISTVANEARDETWQENADLMKGVMWVSTLDARTTREFCIPRDGLMYTLPDYKPMGHSFSWADGPGRIHPNCRSTSCPVLKSAKELGLPIEDLPPSTRASMDGQVPENMKYEDWLRTKPKEFQDEVLGKRRAELWREGRLTSLEDLVNQRGRPLTLTELEAKFPVKKDIESLFKESREAYGDLLHTTTAKAAQGIMEEGFRPSVNSMYGKGVYFSNKALPGTYGDTVLESALLPHKQFVASSDVALYKEAARVTDVTARTATELSESLLAKGYRSIRFPMDDGEIYTVVLDKDIIAATRQAARPTPLPAWVRATAHGNVDVTSHVELIELGKKVAESRGVNKYLNIIDQGEARVAELRREAWKVNEELRAWQTETRSTLVGTSENRAAWKEVRARELRQEEIADAIGAIRRTQRSAEIDLFDAVIKPRTEVAPEYMEAARKRLTDPSVRDLHRGYPRLEGKSMLEEDTAHFFDVMGGRGQSLRHIKVDPERPRACAWSTTRDVNMGKSRDKKTLWHEMGHIVEYEDAHLQEGLRAFRDSRATGPAVPLNDIIGRKQYEAYERAVPGKFFDPYVGKVYTDGATEVLSMGIEMFANIGSMRRLYNEDAEHFHLIMGIIGLK